MGNTSRRQYVRESLGQEVIATDDHIRIIGKMVAYNDKVVIVETTTHSDMLNKGSDKPFKDNTGLTFCKGFRFERERYYGVFFFREINKNIVY